MAALAAELQVGTTVKAQFDYAAANADELTVSEGDIGTIASVRDDGWGTATFEGTTGLIPLNYVAALSAEETKEMEAMSGGKEAAGGSGYAGASASATKDISALMEMDAEDESLRRYKESLMGAAAAGNLGDANDPRRVVVEEFRVVLEDPATEDIAYACDTEAALDALSKATVSLKQKCHYKFKISFRIQHEIVAGLSFTSKVKRGPISDTDQIMIGSYPPGQHEFLFPKNGWNECPSGMLARGKYSAVATFTDSDKVDHSQFKYTLKITK